MINTLSKPGIKEDQSEEGIKKKKNLQPTL